MSKLGLRKEDYSIYHYGKHVGKIDIIIECANLPSIRQMAIGVLTEGGVRISSTPIVGDNKGSGSKKGLPEKMIEIDSSFQEFKKRDLEKGSKSVKMDTAIKQVKNVTVKSIVVTPLINKNFHNFHRGYNKGYKFFVADENLLVCIPIYLFVS